MIKAGEQYSQRNEFEHRDNVSRELGLKYDKRQDLIIPYGKTLGFTGLNGEEVIFAITEAGEFTLTVNGTTVLNIASNATTFELDSNGRVTGLRLSSGTTSSIDMLASALRFYDGTTDRALIEAAGGLFTVNGDVAVGGSIVVGSARLKVGLEPLEFYKVDGDTIEWANGASIGNAPKYTLDLSALTPLAAGEQYDVRLTSVTDTGATVRAKISTPSSTASQSNSTDAAGGVGDPDRVMTKPTSADAYNGVYTFKVSGTVTVTSTYEGELGQYVNSGSCEISTWFNDGGGWDQGPSITIDAYEVVDLITPTDMSGPQAFTEYTSAVSWSAAVGNAASYEFGASLVSGGTLTDLAQISYTTTTASGERSATPGGELLKIIAYPRNL